MKIHKLSALQQQVHALSERLVAAQRPIRILDALKWPPQVMRQFFEQNCSELPQIDKSFYDKTPLPFNPVDKQDELYAIERDIRKFLGQFSPVGSIMQRMCREYREVVRMLAARGTPEFSQISQELYGSTQDVFYAGAPTLKDLASILCDTLPQLKKYGETDLDEKKYSAEEAVAILEKKFKHYFNDPAQTVKVVLSDDIVADAAAGAERIKLRADARFSQRDIQVIEVHEGWVHLATTINGLRQPICTFLSKGPPSSTVTQEGLAIIMEIFTFSSFPARVQRLADRIQAVSIAEDGGDFLDVFNYFLGRDLSKENAYIASQRVFRGSTPVLGPFTKDLSYTKGFVIIYNYIRLAISRGLLDRIPLLFVGKTTLEDLHILEDLVAEKLVLPPKYVPPQFKDLAALSAWLSFSLFFNKVDLDHLSQDYKGFLQDS